MSWSMYLNGPKSVILKELGDAVAVINQAAESLQDTESAAQDTVSLTVSGYVGWDDKGVTVSSTSHNISVTRQLPLAPETAAAPTEPDIQ